MSEEGREVKRVAFIGLGTMGFPMAGHLVEAGFETSVFNRTAQKARAWASLHAGRVGATPALAAAGADVACLCVGNDDDVRSVVYGETGVLSGLSPGAVLVDHTTTSARLARELDAACRARGVAFVDAPVSGGETGAQSGCLTVFCGGEPAVVQRLLPVLRVYAGKVTRMGDAGMGQCAKMVNQTCLAGCVQGLAEGIALGRDLGLDMHAVLEALQGGAAASWQMQNRGHSMVDGRFDFGFAIDWMIKDLKIVLDAAGRTGVPMPVTTLIEGFYEELSRLGFGRADTSALIVRLQQRDASRAKDEQDR